MLETPAGLAPGALEAIAGLEQRVVAADGGRLKLEWGSLRKRPADRRLDVLAWDDDRLVGFAGLYSFAGAPVEIAGAVDPAYRRRGLGSQLLARATELGRAAGRDHALLVCPRTAAGGAEFATARGAVPDHSEHALLLTGDPADGTTDPRTTLRPATVADATQIAALLETGFGFPDDTVADRLADDAEGHVLVERDGAVVGYLRAVLEDDLGGIYGFVIDAGLRGQGIGRDVLRRCCRRLRADGATRVGLEVAIDNDHALGLYTSLGFARVTTEDYFRLAWDPVHQ